MKPKCSTCYTTIRLNAYNGLCYQCHLNQVFNPTGKIAEELKEKQSREILKKENENFDHFLTTGEVKPLLSVTPGGESIKYEPSLVLKIIKQRSS